ncbi:hypothetical protein MAR_013139, partial [Mya arenaria]
SNIASFRGSQILYAILNKKYPGLFTKQFIRQWLDKQTSYATSKQVRRKFRMAQVRVSFIDEQFDADLVYGHSPGYNNDFFITFIKQFKTVDYSDKHLQSNYSNICGLLKNISLVDIVNMFLLTFLEMMFMFMMLCPTYFVITRLMRYFSYKETATFLPVLQDIGDNYNITYNRAIGMRPADIKDINQEEVIQKKKRSQNVKLKLFKLKVGDYVRISHLKTVFTRPYDQTYSGEVFRVQRRYNRGTLPLYRLRDLQNEDIKGTFYQSEYNPNSAFKIERILKTKGKGANQQYFVKWKYYPKEV